MSELANARNLLAIGRGKEAVEAAARAIAEAPNDPEARYVYSVACTAIGKFDHALEPAQNAVQVAPTDQRFVSHLASVYSSLDKNKLAFETFDDALALAPDSPDTHFLHVDAVDRAVRGGGNFRPSKLIERAKTSVYVLLGSYPELAETHAAHARYLLLTEQYQEAAWAAHRALEINPNRALSYQLLGCAFEGVGDKRKAGDAFVMAGKLDPHSSTSGDLLASLAKGSMPPIAFACWVLLRLGRVASSGNANDNTEAIIGPDLNITAIVVVGVILTVVCLGTAIWFHRNKPVRDPGPKYLSPEARAVLAARKELR